MSFIFIYLKPQNFFLKRGNTPDLYVFLKYLRLLPVSEKPWGMKGDKKEEDRKIGKKRNRKKKKTNRTRLPV